MGSFVAGKSECLFEQRLVHFFPALQDGNFADTG